MSFAINCARGDLALASEDCRTDRGICPIPAIVLELLDYIRAGGYCDGEHLEHFSHTDGRNVMDLHFPSLHAPGPRRLPGERPCSAWEHRACSGGPRDVGMVPDALVERRFDQVAAGLDPELVAVRALIARKSRR